MTSVGTRKVFQVLESLYSEVYILAEWLTSLRTEDGKAPQLLEDGDSNSDNIEVSRIKKQGKTKKNAFTIGFEMMSDDLSAQIASLPTVEYKYPNNNFSRLQLSHWKKILSRVGDQVMEYILENTSVFLFVSSNCYTQIIGLPAYDLPSLLSGQQVSLKSSTSKVDNHARGNKSSRRRWKKSLCRQTLGKRKKVDITSHPDQNKKSRSTDSQNWVSSLCVNRIAGRMDQAKQAHKKRKLSNENSGERCRDAKRPKIGPVAVVPSTSGTSSVTGGQSESQGETTDGRIGNVNRTNLLHVDNSGDALNDGTAELSEKSSKGVEIFPESREELLTINGQTRAKKTRRGGKRKRQQRVIPPVFNKNYLHQRVLPRMNCLYARDLREQLPKTNILSMCEATKSGFTSLFISVFTDLVTDKSSDQHQKAAESNGRDPQLTNQNPDQCANQNKDESRTKRTDSPVVLANRDADRCSLKGANEVKESGLQSQEVVFSENRKRKAEQSVDSCKNIKICRFENTELQKDLMVQSALYVETEEVKYKKLVCGNMARNDHSSASSLDCSKVILTSPGTPAGVLAAREITLGESERVESQSGEIINTSNDRQLSQSGEVISNKPVNDRTQSFSLNSGSESLFSSSDHSSKHHLSEMDSSEVSRRNTNTSLNCLKETNPAEGNTPGPGKSKTESQKCISSQDQSAKPGRSLSSSHTSFFDLDDSKEKSEQQICFEKFGLFFGKGSNMFFKGLSNENLDSGMISCTVPLVGKKSASQGAEASRYATCTADDCTPKCVDGMLLSLYWNLDPHLSAFIQNLRVFPFRAFLSRYCPMKTALNRIKCIRKEGKSVGMVTGRDGTGGGGSSHRSTQRDGTRGGGSSSRSTPRLSGPVYHRQNLSQQSSTSQSESQVKLAPRVRLHHKHAGKRSGVRTSVLLEDHVMPRQVFLFLRQVCCRVLPREIIGCQGNWNVLMKGLRRLLSLGKFDKLSLGNLMEKMKVSSCHWLPEGGCHSDRLAVFAQVIWWIFTSFIMIILKSFFYITDTTVYRNKLFYYRKPVWRRLKQHAQKDYLKNGILKPQSLAKVRAQLKTGESLGLAHLRFLPKTKSLRPIVNMGKKPPAESVKDLPINKQLADVFQILSFEKTRSPDLLGSSVFGADQVYTRWKKFITHRRNQHDTRQLYFVKVDIKNCFDSINQQKLFDIISNIIRQSGAEEYIIRKYVKLVPAGGKVKRSFCRHVTELHDFEPDFTKFVKWLTREENARNALIVDQILHQHVSPDAVLDKLHRHLFNNIIKIGTKHYLQTTGISQGSILSTLLCNLYYGDMEQGVLSPGKDELVMRMVDDWLYVTPYHPRAVGFLNSMLNGHPDYNCYTNTTKTLINFSHTSKEHGPISQVNDQEAFPWCGMSFDMETLSLSVDYSRYAGVAIADTMTFDISHQPGITMKNKLMGALRVRCHGLYLDSQEAQALGGTPVICRAFSDMHNWNGLMLKQINTLDVVIFNAYKMFLLLAYKFHASVRRLPAKHRANDHPLFFLGVMEDLALYFHHQTTAKLTQLDVDATFPLSKHTVKWLCFQAFSMKLTNHQSEYYLLLKTIKVVKKTLQAKSISEDMMEVCAGIGEDIPPAFLSMLD